jgi:hypothetical protein
MSPDEAKHVVIVGVLGAGAIAAIDQARQGHAPTARIGVGVIISGTILLVVAEFLPALAAGFGALLLVTSAFVTGAGTWSALANITK